MGEAVPQHLFLFIGRGQLHSVFLFPVRYPVGAWGLPVGAVILCSVTGKMLVSRVFSGSYSMCVWCALRNLKPNIDNSWEIKTGGVQ